MVQEDLKIKNSILVVDNSSDTLKLVDGVLSARGHKVLTASQPSTAIRLFHEHPELKLILLDIDLESDTNGIALAKRFQEERGSREFAMAFISGKRVDQSFLDAALRIGVGTFIPKPVQLDKLITKVEDLLGMSCDTLDLSRKLVCDFACELVHVNILPVMKIVQVTPASFLVRSSANFLKDSVLHILCQGLEPHLTERYFTVKVLRSKPTRKDGDPLPYIVRTLLIEPNYQVRLALDSLFANQTPPAGFQESA
ncbi:MAG TPA: response regulator [Oligoflexus sp.]|uniref:response regulator n=1 Tax=Oligoflexus sp. TaxID=1971216 RepID=UPI002D6BA4AA|nr:response regulator [Oligoflexus sp.]HYX35542.1 response regulator [Oligoflexus sp.]